MKRNAKGDPNHLSMNLLRIQLATYSPTRMGGDLPSSLAVTVTIMIMINVMITVRVTVSAPGSRSRLQYVYWDSKSEIRRSSPRALWARLGS
jgi:hypothetical protein